MVKKQIDIEIPDELIMNKKLIVHGKKVILDADFVALYGVKTKRLNCFVHKHHPSQ